MDNEVCERVCRVVAKYKGRPVEQVTIESTFEGLGLDSLDGMNLLFELESEFDISILDEEAKSIRSIRQMVEGVEKLLAAQSAGAAVPERSA